MERGMETFQRDYKLVEDGYKNHLDVKANSEASLPPSERMPSAEKCFHAYLRRSHRPSLRRVDPHHRRQAGHRCRRLHHRRVKVPLNPDID
jgi:hypothetical protein